MSQNSHSLKYSIRSQIQGLEKGVLRDRRSKDALETGANVVLSEARDKKIRYLAERIEDQEREIALLKEQLKGAKGR